MRQIYIFLLVLFPTAIFAQSSVSIENQAYPAGIIPGIRFDLDLTTNSYLTSRIGYNVTDRKDYGKNDNEEGGGPGFSLGYSRTDFLTQNLSLDVRADLWFLDIDWEDTQTICGTVPPCFESNIEGSTEITVLQPTFGIGYYIYLGENFFIKPSLSFGYEINIKTDGRKVGEGAILLGGLNFGFKL